MATAADAVPAATVYAAANTNVNAVTAAANNTAAVATTQ